MTSNIREIFVGLPKESLEKLVAIDELIGFCIADDNSGEIPTETRNTLNLLLKATEDWLDEAQQENLISEAEKNVLLSHIVRFSFPARRLVSKYKPR
jgi:hypothetical protein